MKWYWYAGIVLGAVVVYQIIKDMINDKPDI
jgi:hypothetical protein